MFSLYLPGRHGNTIDVLEEVGAGWACDQSVSPRFIDVDEGPDGGLGKLVYFDSKRRLIPYPITSIDQSSQHWQQAAPEGELPGGRYWIGIPKEYAPTPDDLQRETVVDGVPITLLDGHGWTVPVSEYIPKLMSVCPQTGEERLTAMPQYVRFIEQTNELFLYLIGDEFQGLLESQFRVVIPRGLAYAADALSVNYRLDLNLTSMLKLIGEFEAVKIAGVATGLDLVATVDQKKTLRAKKSCVT